MKKVKPISPEGFVDQKNKSIPEKVIEVVNKLLTLSSTSKHIVILQKDIISELIKNGFDEDEIFKNHWLDFESLYRDAGWNVEYDKPGFNESYEARFIFSSKAKHWLLVLNN